MFDLVVGQNITTGIGRPGYTDSGGLVRDFKGVKIDVILELMVADEFDLRLIGDKEVGVNV